MNRVAKFSALFFSAALSCLIAQDDISGVWKLQTQRPDGTYQESFLDLQQKGDTVTGKVYRNFGGHAIHNGTYQNGKLHFEYNLWREVMVKYDGELKDGKLDLTIERSKSLNQPQGEVEHAAAVRSTEEAMKPPAAIPPPALHDVPDNGLAKTPPMGWNSWNHFAGKVDDAVVRAAADSLVASGMKKAGYIYVNIDDTWEGPRDAQGYITTNKKFPDMKALADYVHSKGLKLGIYSGPGPLTCAGYPASFGHEKEDAESYAKWGIDYLKYDWCSAGSIYKDSDMHAIYQKMGDALHDSGRPIVYSLCQYGKEDVWTWGPKVSGNLWRTTGDISDSWASMTEIGFKQIDIAKYAQPGHWNDPDMLEVGNGGMTNDEYRVHMTLWSLLSAPLLAGNDLQKMSKETLALLTNHDVIAIDQDPAVHHPKRYVQDGGVEIWTRELHDGATVIAVFNRADEQKSVNMDWSKIEVKKPAHAKELWTGKNVKFTGDSYTATVPRHGVVLLRVPKA